MSHAGRLLSSSPPAHSQRAAKGFGFLFFALYICAHHLTPGAKGMNPAVDEGEMGPRGEGDINQPIEGASEQATFASGSTRIVLNDHSHHNHSKHHYGDVHVTTTNYNAVQTSVDMRLNQARDLLLAHVSLGALHNSAQRGPDAPKCYPETRVAVQQDILGWIKRGHQGVGPQSILWLSGPAGSGKTAIVGSIADACHNEGMLAAGFFFSSFSGSSDRCSKTPFIATLIYQLIQHDKIVGLRDEVLAVLDRDPLILKRNLDYQVDALILQPLRKVVGRSDPQGWPRLILVDGLDECGGHQRVNESEQASRSSREEGHREILSVLVRISSDSSFPFLIIIASRPERTIKAYISSLPEGMVKCVFLNDKYSPTADIELFLRAMLAKIGWELGLVDGWYQLAIPRLWPHDINHTTDVVRYLAQEASEQFIYATTVIRYIQDGTDTPQEQLKRVLTWRGSRSASSKPLAALDELYTRILQSSSTPLESVRWILAVRCLSHKSEPGWFVNAILESWVGETQFYLGGLTSLIGIRNDKGEACFTFYHKALFDFLEDPKRCGELHEDFTFGAYRFTCDRFYRVLKNRGPQIPLPDDQLIEFNRALCLCFFYHFWATGDQSEYNADDVEWWFGQFLSDDRLIPLNHRVAVLQEAFWKCHNISDCGPFRCASSCSVWRNAIMRFCKADGWCVPTSMWLFWEKLPGAYQPIPLNPPGRFWSEFDFWGERKFMLSDSQ